MIVAFLGGPNAGKSSAAARRAGCLYLPVFWVRIACQRRDRSKFWKRDWHHLLNPQAFTLTGGKYPPPGERTLIDTLCDGKTELQLPEADMQLAAHLFCVCRKRWRKLGRDIIAEGELLTKEAWLKALNPDRVRGFYTAPRLGLITTQRRKGLHPPGDWDDEKYRARQIAINATITKWLKGEL